MPRELGPLVDPALFGGDALDAARSLLGMVLVHGEVALRITECEAYRWPDDTANHCRAGRTPRNAPMWGPPGRAYVYLCYGIHQLFNVTAGPEGEGAGVLVRACEAVRGEDIVAARRGGRRGAAALAGPGKVGAALAVDTSFSHHPLCEAGGLELRAGWAPEVIWSGPRVGIDFAEPAHRLARWRLADGQSRVLSHRGALREEALPLRDG